MNVKGQMETMGLIIIIVIIGFMLVFWLVSVASEQGGQDTVKERYGEQALASGFVSVLVETSMCNTDYATLVKDCALGNSIQCDGASSCNYLEEQTSVILSKTLDDWEAEYKFIVFREEIGNPLFEIGSECAEMEAPGRQLIPLYPIPGNAEVRLEICKS